LLLSRDRSTTRARGQDQFCGALFFRSVTGPISFPLHTSQSGVFFHLFFPPRSPKLGLILVVLLMSYITSQPAVPALFHPLSKRPIRALTASVAAVYLRIDRRAMAIFHVVYLAAAVTLVLCSIAVCEAAQELRLVQIVFRHGDRSSLYTVPAWGDEAPHWPRVRPLSPFPLSFSSLSLSSCSIDAQGK
jgi:hypothetical protein